MHSTSANLSENVREGIIARFHTTVHGDAMQLDDGGVATDVTRHRPSLPSELHSSQGIVADRVIFGSSGGRR